MTFEHNDMSGSIFKNDRREKDSQPNAKGSCKINGIEYWISAWTKQGKNGPFQSLAFQEKDEKPASNTPVDAGDDNFDDDIPF